MPLTGEKLLDLATVCLNTYYPGWDNEKPAKYIIPKYENMDKTRRRFVTVCEEDILRILEKPKAQRTPDEIGELGQYNCKKAETRVCQVLEEIDDHFIVIRNLENPKWMRKVFQALQVNLDNMKMPDFIVLGPGFGVFLIEVKAGLIEGRAKKQLNAGEHSIRAVLKAKFSENSNDRFPIGKILVTGDVDKPSCLPSDLSDPNEDYVQFFKQDLHPIDSENGKSRMHNELKRLMSIDARPINTDMFQYLAKTLVLLRSVKPSSSSTGLIEPHSFQCAAVKSEGILTRISRIKKQQRRGRFAKLKQYDIIMSTPDQLEAIDCEHLLQVIAGPAGTGKTIILLAKAIERMEAGRQVVVISAPTYLPQYQKKFDDSGLKGKYKIYFYYALAGKLWLSTKFNSMFLDIVNKPAEILFKIFNQHRHGGPDQRPLMDILDEVEEILKDAVDKIVRILPELMKKRIFKKTFLANGDIFMDDALISYGYDTNGWKLLLLLYALAKFKNSRGHHLWICLDPLQNGLHVVNPYQPELGKNFRLNKEEQIQLLNFGIKTLEMFGFSVKRLNQVMRCTMAVQKHAYQNADTWACFGLHPECVHSIEGIPPVIMDIQRLETEDDVWTRLTSDVCNRVMEILDAEQPIKNNYIGVLVSDCTRQYSDRSKLQHIINAINGIYGEKMKTSAEICTMMLDVRGYHLSMISNVLLREVPNVPPSVNGVMVGNTVNFRSCEYTVVIHCIVRETGQPLDEQLLQQYRYVARTRCTTTFFESVYVFNNAFNQPLSTLFGTHCTK